MIDREGTFHGVAGQLAGKWPVLAGIWLCATAFNITKAYHMDDTAYLEISRWIAENPLGPMSGVVHWGEGAEPIHRVNQPHLFFYLMALWGSLWGYGEVAMHLLLAIFTAFCIVFIHGIAEIVRPGSSLLLTALLALSPAFVVGQNVMVDIPLLAAWLAFYYCLLRPGDFNEWKRWTAAGLLAGTACLIKYQSVVLIVVLIASLLWHRQHRRWPAAVIPLVILGIWSWFNYLDYGSVHVMDRPLAPLSVGRTASFAGAWILCLGAVVPYSLAFFPRLAGAHAQARKFVHVLLALLVANTSLVILGVALRWVPEGAANGYLRFLFLANGTVMLWGIVKGLGKSALREAASSFHLFLLSLWLLSGAAFVIAFAPFMATRHTLISLVPLTLLLALSSPNRHRGWNATALALTLLLTTMLGMHDWNWAAFYREKARRIAEDLPRGAQVHFVGHWGWQWYATQNGMRQLTLPDPLAKPGDYLVVPEGLLGQTVDPSLRREPVRTYREPFSFWNLFATSHGASFYASTFEAGPWNVSRKPFRPIKVYRVPEK